MAIQNQGWAYVSGSGAAGTPGGADTNIQFNNNGTLSGSSELITDGSGSLSASVHISASAFYGDGSNLTGLTASAVNVADGPEQAIQFRVDTPVSGEISGSSALMFLTASNTLSGSNASFTTVSASALSASGDTYVGNNLFVYNNSAQLWGGLDLNSVGITAAGPIADVTTLSASQNISASAFYGDGSNLTNLPGGGGGIFTELDSSNAYTTSSLSIGTSDAPAYALDVHGHMSVGISGTGYIISNSDIDTYIQLGGAEPPGVDGISLVVGGKRMLMLDENASVDSVTLGSGSADLIIVSGSLITSGTIESNTLTSGRVLLAGTDGVIEDNSDIVYDGSVLKVMSKDGFNGSIYTQTGSFAVLNAAATGYLASVGSDGQISASSDMHTAGILNVQGAANLNGNTTVEGNLTANNGLDVSGAQSNFATSVSITGSSDVGLNVSSVFTGGASILSTGNILAGHTGGGAHTAHMNSDGEISGSAIQGASLSVDGDIRCGTGLQTLGSQQISFGTKLTGYTNTIASPFYRVYPVDTSALTGSTMVILPAISAATHGLELTIKDIGNNAGTYTINVTGATGSGDKMETSTAYKAINGNNAWATIVAQSGSSGTHVWWQIAGRAW